MIDSCAPAAILRYPIAAGFVPRACVGASEWDKLEGWIADAGYASHEPDSRDMQATEG